MKKRPSLFLLFFCFLFCLAGAGCATSTSSAGTQPDVNILGVVKTYDGAYKPHDRTTLFVRTGELGSGQRYSGDSVELLWGLITISDY